MNSFIPQQSNQYRITDVNAVWGSSTPKVTAIQQPILSLRSAPVMTNGYVKGYRQPVGRLQLDVSPYQPEQITYLLQALQHDFPAYPYDLSPAATTEELVICFGQLLLVLQKKAGHPIFDNLYVEAAGESLFYLWVPMLNGQCLHRVIHFLLNYINRHAALLPWMPSDMITQQKNELFHFLQACAPSGANCYRFIQAAHLAQIPWMFVGVNSFQFGYGAHSRWFDSSIMDDTSYIAVKLSRDKWHAARLLKSAGIPTPEKFHVTSEEEAIRIAQKVGYPVVLKPDNQDGGDGVTANIQSLECLRKAYGYARKYSVNVLLEKHLVGKDYRLVVLNGQLIWAIERIPAGVYGDGISTIETLVQIENQSLARTREFSPVRKLAFNDESIEYMKEQGWSIHSIPEKGRFVALCRIANISRGGTAVGVFDSVHPDNRRLVENTAKLFRLNLAGIDLILPSIQQSYLETGGHIIEVNSQPQLGASTAPHLYHQILTTILPNRGRIPIIVIVGYHSNASFVQHIKADLGRNHQVIGVANNKKVFMNDTLVSTPNSLFDAGKALLLMEGIQAIIFCVNHLHEIEQGLPFDHYDVLFFLDEPLASSPMLQREEDLIDTLFKGCTKQSVVLESGLNYLETFSQVIPANMTLVLNDVPEHDSVYPVFIDKLVYLNEPGYTLQSRKGELVSKQMKNHLDDSDVLPSLSKLLLSAYELSFL